MADDKATQRNTEEESVAYKAGRSGDSDILGTDNEREAAARERGSEDKINAEKTAEENKASEDSE